MFSLIALWIVLVSGEWIWPGSDVSDVAPVNQWTYFRTIFNLTKPLQSSDVLRVAADSNTALFINGVAIRRRVTRYDQTKITNELITSAELTPILLVGQSNVLLFRHHNWGNVETFQRTGQVHAGLWVSSTFGLQSTAGCDWHTIIAPQYLPHKQQIYAYGSTDTTRIRFPQIIHGEKAIPGDLNSPTFNDSSWACAKSIDPSTTVWPSQGPSDVETPGQTGSFVSVVTVIAAGDLVPAIPLSVDDPQNISPGVKSATYNPNSDLTTQIQQSLTQGTPFTLKGNANTSVYVTVGFDFPVHGYPQFQLASSTTGTVIDLGYCERWQDQYSGDILFNPDTGSCDPERIVGNWFSDRYIVAGSSSEDVEIPDERTVRWITFNIHFLQNGQVTFSKVGLLTNQYPVTQTGSFESDDPIMDAIVALSLTHAKISMSDSYVDTPGREDGQWIEDAQLRAVLSDLWFNDTRLRKILIRSQAEAEKSNGYMHPFPPSNYNWYPAPYDWSVSWVGSMYDDYVETGDSSWIVRYWNNLVLYWNDVLSHVNSEGVWLTSNVLADINVGVHCSGNDCSSGLVTPWIIQRLSQSVIMANATNQTAQANQWQNTATLMTAAFKKYFIVSGNGLPTHVPDVLWYNSANPQASTTQGYSQAGQTVAVYTDLLTADQSLQTLNYAYPDPEGTPPAGLSRWNNPTYLYRALTALSYVNQTTRAVNHLKERFSQYLPSSLSSNNTTPLKLQGSQGGPLPEYWISRADNNIQPGQANPSQPRDATGSHGWASVGLVWIQQNLLGVKTCPPQKGQQQREVFIRPHSGGLPYVSGNVFVYGKSIQIKWKITSSQGELTISVPTNLTVHVQQPLECGSRLLTHVDKIDSLTLVKNGQYHFVC